MRACQLLLRQRTRLREDLSSGCAEPGVTSSTDGSPSPRVSDGFGHCKTVTVYSTLEGINLQRERQNRENCWNTSTALWRRFYYRKHHFRLMSKSYKYVKDCTLNFFYILASAIIQACNQSELELLNTIWSCLWPQVEILEMYYVYILLGEKQRIFLNVASPLI